MNIFMIAKVEEGATLQSFFTLYIERKSIKSACTLRVNSYVHEIVEKII
jgi:hypothetical protein